jgi:hypothetical protein
MQPGQNIAAGGVEVHNKDKEIEGIHDRNKESVHDVLVDLEGLG